MFIPWLVTIMLTTLCDILLMVYLLKTSVSMKSSQNCVIIDKKCTLFSINWFSVITRLLSNRSKLSMDEKLLSFLLINTVLSLNLTDDSIQLIARILSFSHIIYSINDKLSNLAQFPCYFDIGVEFI